MKKTTKQALIVFPIIIGSVAIYIYSQSNPEKAASFTILIAMLITYLQSTVTDALGGIERSLKILFYDFRFDFFVLKEVITWIYAIGMVFFFDYFLKGILLGDGNLVLLSFGFFIAFRIILEICITAFTTAENTSLLAGKEVAPDIAGIDK